MYAQVSLWAFVSRALQDANNNFALIHIKKLSVSLIIKSRKVVLENFYEITIFSIRLMLILNQSWNMEGFFWCSAATVFLLEKVKGNCFGIQSIHKQLAVLQFQHVTHKHFGFLSKRGRSPCAPMLLQWEVLGYSPVFISERHVLSGIVVIFVVETLHLAGNSDTSDPTWREG